MLTFHGEIKQMNIKRIVLTGFAVFLAVFLMDYLINEVLLTDLYHQTASIWRSEMEMRKLLVFMPLGQLLFSFFFTIIFSKGYEGSKSGLGQGLRFGLLVALMIEPATTFTWYAVLPVPSILAVYWFVSGFIELTVMGCIAGMLYRPAR